MDDAVPIKMSYKHFKDGWGFVEHDPRSGRPVTSRPPENVEHVQAAINKDQQLTGRELEADLGISKTTVFEILIQDLGMKCVMAKFIPWLLLPEQDHRAAVANGLIQTTTNEPDFLKKVIPRDESWVHSYETQFEDPGNEDPVVPVEVASSPCLKKVWQSCGKIKTMLTVFSDWEAVVYHEYVPPGQTFNKEYCLNVLC